jgi:hypothetical protein
MKMKSVSHTPSPWTAGGWSSNGTPIIAKDPLKPHGRTVAIVPCEFRDASSIGLGSSNEQADYEVGTTKANAQLISAAPDLLESCEDLVDALRHHDYSHEGCDLCAFVSQAKFSIAKAKGLL